MDHSQILDWVTNYGAPALSLLLLLGIVGLPVPDETLLVFSGYLVFKGRFNLHVTWLAALGGSIAGITISYMLGRTLGLKLAHRYGRRFGVTEERLHRVHDWMRGAGHWGLTFGYFVPGVRHFTALIAGASCLEWRVFAAFAYGGAILWVSTFLALGYFLGESWKHASKHVEEGLMIGAGVLAAAALGYYLYRRRKTK